MLPKTYRYTAYNDSGASSDVTIKEEAWKFDSNGALAYSAIRTPMNAVTIANAALGVGTTQGNSTDLYLGATLSVDATGTGTAGLITIFIEFSEDGGTTWPDAQKGIPIGALNAGDSNVSMTA